MFMIVKHSDREQHRLNIFLGSNNINIKSASFAKQIFLDWIFEDFILDPTHIPRFEKFFITKINWEGD